MIKTIKRFMKLVTATLSIILLLGGIEASALELNGENTIENDFVISGEAARIIAIRHIQSVLLLAEDESSGDWHWGICLGEANEMFDSNNEISSFYFEVTNEEGEPAGYIVVGASQKYAPIIEYSTNGTFYPVEILDFYDAERICYEGGYDYSVRKQDVELNIFIDGVVQEVNYDVEEKLNVDIDVYADEWKVWTEYLSDLPSLSSNPPTTGDQPITKPSDYESISGGSDNVPGYQQIYKTTNDFVGYNNHCSPTAATNIMLYWYGRNSTLYSTLRKNGDNTWNDTFERFYTLMKTNVGTAGTKRANFKDAYETYLSEAGFGNATVIYNSTATWNSMYIEINDDYPFHLSIQDHYLYGNHSVVGIGYEEYIYGPFSTSRYIRVADGWTSTYDRYIHTKDGVGSIAMVAIRPQ